MVGTILFYSLITRMRPPSYASRLLLVLPSINRFFQMAIFKLRRLFRNQIVGQDDCFDDTDPATSRCWRRSGVLSDCDWKVLRGG